MNGIKPLCYPDSPLGISPLLLSLCGGLVLAVAEAADITEKTRLCTVVLNINQKS